MSELRITRITHKIKMTLIKLICHKIVIDVSLCTNISKEFLRNNCFICLATYICQIVIQIAIENRK